MNHRCLGYVLRVHAAWGEKKNKTKKKKRKRMQRINEQGAFDDFSLA